MPGFDVDFEVEILSAAAADKTYRLKIQQTIKGVMPWSTRAHRHLWELLDKLHANDELNDLVIEKFAEGILDEDDAEEFEDVAADILERVPTVSGFAADELDDWARFHRLKDGTRRIINKLTDNDTDEAEAVLREVAQNSMKAKVGIQVGDWLSGLDERQEKRKEEKANPQQAAAIRTRIPSLDVAMKGGLRRNQFGLIVGPTNIGKSFIMLNLAFNGAVAGNLTLAICTEMSKDVMDTRLDARCFRKKTDDFATYNFSKKDLDRIAERQERLRDRMTNMLHTCSTPINSLTQAGLEEEIDKIEQKTGQELRFLVMDSGDHMRPMKAYKDKRLEQSAVYWDLKKVTDERELSTWCSAHAPGGYKHLLTEHDIAESKDKGKIADFILTLNQSPQEARKNLIRTFLAKSRHSEKNSYHWLLTAYGYATYEEVEPPEDDDWDEDGHE
jgi:replicative DNA helicase